MDSEEAATWKVSDRRNALRHFEDLTSKTFVPCKWVVPEALTEDGKTVHYVGWPEYDPQVEAFFSAVWSEGPNPYNEGDWQEFYGSFWTNPKQFESATVDELRRFFMILKRQERFGDGTI
ncbi:MAG TPA: DUF6508 domain-containing protein, partial [Fimbriimonadaceae bacterium]|nr:DUF6508 domain-containing protein [Fimbriimonadaceae bacterium]